MFVPKNHEVTMRCPVCFCRDVDVLMKYENNHYFCLKCSYQGSEAEVRKKYVDLKKKFQWIDRRITVEEYGRI